MDDFCLEGGVDDEELLPLLVSLALAGVEGIDVLDEDEPEL